nr:hypothetical protein [Komagataeibacter xylinus]
MAAMQSRRDWRWPAAPENGATGGCGGPARRSGRGACIDLAH